MLNLKKKDPTNTVYDDMITILKRYGALQPQQATKSSITQDETQAQPTESRSASRMNTPILPIVELDPVIGPGGPGGPNSPSNRNGVFARSNNLQQNPQHNLFGATPNASRR